MSDFSIAVDARQEVHDALLRIGRTEDAAFSPDNRRLALVCFDRHSIAIADLEITPPPGSPHVTITRVVEYGSASFKAPHGIDFLDDEHVVVANRYGRVVVFRLPDQSSARGDRELVPLTLPAGHDFELVGGPGSVRIVRDQGTQEHDAPVEILLCNNKRSTVTRHAVDGSPPRVTRSDVLLRRHIDFPDGVAAPHDREWIAVSNHDAHVVMLYRWTSSLSEHSEPDCILRGSLYPHGLQFSADGRHLLVADSASPHINVYARPGDRWHGIAYPSASARVMSDDVYWSSDDQETRGPKGFGLDRDGRVLAVTYERQPVAFHDAGAMLEHSTLAHADEATQLAYELDVIERARARLDERTAVLMSSTSYRITKPLRVLNASVGTRRRRRS